MQVPSHRTAPVPPRQAATISNPTNTTNGMTRFNDNYSHQQSLEFSQSQQDLLLPPTLPGKDSKPDYEVVIGLTLRWAGVPNPGFDQFSRTFDFDPMAFQYNQPATNVLDVGFDDFSVPDMGGFVDNMPLLQFPNQPSGQEALVMHYFETVQKVQPFFAGEALTDVTYGVSKHRYLRRLFRGSRPLSLTICLRPGHRK